MMRLTLAAAMLCAGFLPMAPARAQLFGADGLDPAFCKQPTFRQTVARCPSQT